MPKNEAIINEKRVEYHASSAHLVEETFADYPRSHWMHVGESSQLFCDGKKIETNVPHQLFLKKEP